MPTAPVILFVYNRPQFTRQTLLALSKNELAKETDLFIFADGPKKDSTPEQIAAIQEVSDLAKRASGFKSVTIQSSPVNKGLANAVIDGVQQMINLYESVIVIEDDVVTSPYFLSFMNNALQLYQSDEKVISIGSWNYYYKDPLMQSFFTPLPDTIAWATWRNRWQQFEREETILYQALKDRNLLHAFNLQGRFPYETMLQQQIAGKVNSWAIRWTANAVLQQKLCLYPNISLSKHIGFGNDSTHVKSADYNADLQLADAPITVGGIPVVENPAAVEAFIHFEKVIRPLKTSRKKQWKKQWIDQWELVKHPLKQILKKKKFGWFGNYSQWETAVAATTGYDQQSILEKVKSAILKVKTGTAVYERDGVLFDTKTYSVPLVSTLLYVAAKNKNGLSVLDFGGSLGSSYFQNKEILDALFPVQWNVVEQLNFVNVGRECMADDTLQFFETADAVVTQKGLPQLLMLSCTLPYIEKPYALLAYLASLKVPYLLIENTPFHFANEDRLTIQKVNPAIYEASYPCWFLNKSKLIEELSSSYRVILNEYTGTTITLDRHTIPYQSILFELKS